MRVLHSGCRLRAVEEGHWFELVRDLLQSGGDQGLGKPGTPSPAGRQSTITSGSSLDRTPSRRAPLGSDS